MNVIGFDKKIAKQNGYDIRKDDRGVEYTIPEDTPQGSMEGARFMPGQEPSGEASSGVTPFNTTYGDCGTATLTGAGKSFSTAYAITNTWLGFATSHTWRVPVASSQGYQIYNLDGLAPAFSYSWTASRSISFRGWPYNSYVSNGQVVTALGFVCSSMSPSDSWYGE
ncbi:hypothetical protein [Paenarthrobacter nitroguajacolicus]|uniref:hypothetical protein n=1 Tax=Paenarthrobacter nitroguajacolicus TaxID=211146 RepID=UPI003AF34508